MPEQSKNYSLPKPLGHEYMNREIHNDLIDSIDGAIKQAEDTAKNHTDELVDQAEINVKDSQAETTRNAIHSGFMNLSDLDLSEPTKITLLKEEKANINGYILTIPEGTEIELPEAPTDGKREDLVFLEAWFPIEGNGYDMSRRFRTVVGVDVFDESNFEDGFPIAYNVGYDYGFQGGKTYAIPQGGNNEPLNGDSYLYNFSRSDDSQTQNVKMPKSHDRGLYLTGRPDDTSKYILQTADGYVYAIPMFRIKRRNSGGYSVSNGNGAREWFGVNLASTYIANTYELHVTDASNYMIGDYVYLGTGYKDIKILSIDYESNKLTVDKTWHYDLSTSTFVRLESDRPDNLYSNIIDQRDIMDLRHKVSLTSVDYNKVMQEEFNCLLEGKNGNVEMKKEYFGLEKAPSYIEPELQSVKVKGNDGVTRELTNILGDASFRDNDLGLWSKMNGSYDYTISFEPSNSKEYNSVVLTSHSADPTTSRCVFRSNVSLSENQHYIFISDVEINDGARGEMRIAASNDITLLTGKFETSGKYYLKFYNESAINDGWTGVYNRTEVGEDGKTIKVNGMRLYEIDQETYNKIDVDPEFTGEELVKKLPYVNSYPNVVENLLPNFDEGWNDYSSGKGIILDSLHVKFESDTSINRHYTFFVPVQEGIEYGILTGSEYEESGAKAYFYFNNATAEENPSTSRRITESIQNGLSVIAPIGSKYAECVVLNVSGTGDSELLRLPIFYKVEYGKIPYSLIPHGKWYIPYDYINGDVNTRFDLTDQKRILSDAQTSQKVSDKIEVLSNDHLKHFEVIQSVEGVWSVGDTIKINGYDGIVSGVIDVDTALTRVISYADGQTHKDLTLDSTKFTLTDVSKLSIGDTYNLWQPDYEIDYSLTITVIDIDVDNNIISTDVEYNSSDISTYWIVETTTDTSTPVVKADGISGTWTNLATSEATYIIDTVPSDNTVDILIEYSVNYAGGDGIEHVPTEVLEGEVNRQKVVRSEDGIVTIKVNFEGKTAGNTDLNPHSFWHKHYEGLASPDMFITELPQASYNQISSLDEELAISQILEEGKQAEKLFRFNVIRVIQDKLGEGFFEGCVTIEDKIQRAKDQIEIIICNWWGYGENPGGFNANFAIRRTESSEWENRDSHTSSDVSDLLASTGNMDVRIDDNGFVHFLAYTDPSDGVTPSTLYTNHVELEIQIDVSELGYNVLVPEKQFPVLTENLLTANQALPVDLEGYKENHLDEATNEISDFGVIKTSIVDGSSGAGWYHAVQTPVIPNVTYTMSAEIRSASDVDAALRTELRLGNENVNVDLYSGTLPTEWTKVSRSFTVTNENTAFRFVFYLLGTESGTVSYEARNFKLEKGINPNSTWTPGRKSKTTLNYLGKVVGDDVSVPHKFYRGTRTTQDDPSTYTAENSSENYNSISKLDGILYPYTTSTEGNYAQHVFEFDLSHLGLSLFELKDKFRKLTVSWTGYGQGDNGSGLAYGVVLDWWVDNNNWWNPNYDGNKHSSDSPQTITVSNSSVYGSDIYRLITNNQKVYILVESIHPAGANSDSIVSTVYIKLDVELSEEVDYIKSNIVKVRKETKEIKLEYPITDHRTGITDSVALWYDHMPVPKPLETTEDVTVLSELGDILISDLSSAVGDKQGTHHWMNPLYRVGNDSLNVFGEFGFANIPLAADSKNANVGKSIQINGSGFRDFFITQYGISTLQKPMVGIIGNLVMHENEIKLLVVSIYNETGLIDTSQNGVCLLLPIKGKPLVKLEEGERNSAITPNAWRTQTGEIQGYLDQNGELILTYQ
ncbi:carbohydrate binding domain-containing protein [Chengkuizengella marina]|uniref:Uncharacterized protein n=1 Tax=Chengkuizengella marina TaxID=2507566 RepID=A0A6N9Q7S0_9BACL|nr:hypothetical protein [Chengkuizengella marina]NBI30917.1 hypothetical protein [Chengkuizengella marina]